MGNEYIWCPKHKQQKAIEVCRKCEDRDTCEEYQKKDLAVVAMSEKALALDEKVEDMKNRIFDTYFDLGQVLREIRDGMLYKEFGYEDLEEYAQKRHGFSYRKAAYLIAIVENCEKAGLSKDEVRGIEWSKMACLPSLTDENRAKWLAKAKEMSVEELKNEVKKSRGEDETEEKKFISFSLSLAQKEVVDRALELAAKLTGSEVKSFHLEVLAMEFVGTYGAMDEAAVVRFKNVYGTEEEESGEDKLF